MEKTFLNASIIMIVLDARQRSAQEVLAYVRPEEHKIGKKYYWYLFNAYTNLFLIVFKISSNVK